MTHLINANALSVPLKDKSVHMIACSSPYWGLRDYGNDGQLGQEKIHDCEAWARNERPCGKCFVCNLRIVAAEAWRVLRDDGTFWLNLGDSFASGSDSGLKDKDLSLVPSRVALALQKDGWYVRSDVIWGKTNPMSESVNGWRWEQHRVKVDGAFRPCPGCDKCGSTGGYVLRKGAWRPTRAHEFIFLLTKSPEYYCDKYAVTVPYANSTIERITQETFDQQTGGAKDYAKNGTNPSRSIRRAMTNLRNARFGTNKQDSGNEFTPDAESGRNRWTVWGIEEDEYEQFLKWRTWMAYFQQMEDTDVWNIPTKGYPGAHFAVWPNELVNPMIKASTSDYGVCPECGAPWARVIEKSDAAPAPGNPNPVKSYPAASKTQGSEDSNTTLHKVRQVGTVAWMPTCNCGREDVVPAFVLDLFAGSGTTLQEARALGRTGIGLDISFEYLATEAHSRLELDELDSWNRGDGSLLKTNPRAKKPEVDPRQVSIFDLLS